MVHTLYIKYKLQKTLLMPISGDDINTEAWIIRNLVTVLAGAARRPHRPRSPEMRTLFRAIGIDVPENVAIAEHDGSLAASPHFLESIAQLPHTHIYIYNTHF